MKNKKIQTQKQVQYHLSSLSLSQGFICSLCLVSPWTLSLHLLFL